MPSRAALARHPLSIIGAMITTASAVAFIALATAAGLGLFANPYAGLVIFVALPAIFLIGLLLIPAGMRLQARALRRDPLTSAEWPVIDLRVPRTRRVAWMVAALTILNMVIVLVAGYGTLHWMESPRFCGQVCHTPMHPQFTAWQAGPHAQVACVTCHIGEGARAFVHYKLAGVRQLVHVTTNSYPRPIRGMADMRPALETCGACHSSSRDVGDRLRVIREYADDEANTETTTLLQMHVGGAGRPTSAGRAIHWHADPRVRIEYATTDNRETMPYVKVTDANGRVREFIADGANAAQLARAEHRRMDCLDCHNAIGHRVAPTAEKAVDAAIADGAIGRQLPFVRREGVKLVSKEYTSDEAARDAIARRLRTLYRTGPAGSAHADPKTDESVVQQAIHTLQTVYARNVFSSMKVTYATYPDHLGHMTSTGCFRCHDGSHTAKDGSTISADCEYCHKDVTNP